MKQEITPEDYLHRLLTQPERPDCPVRRTLELLAGKWRTQVLYQLCRAPACRFSQLKRAIPGITSTMLTLTLKELGELGLVRREAFHEIPPRVEYSLTEKGRGLLPVFTELARWGERYLDGESGAEEVPRREETRTEEAR